MAVLASTPGSLRLPDHLLLPGSLLLPDHLLLPGSLQLPDHLLPPAHLLACLQVGDFSHAWEVTSGQRARAVCCPSVPPEGGRPRLLGSATTNSGEGGRCAPPESPRWWGLGQACGRKCSATLTIFRKMAHVRCRLPFWALHRWKLLHVSLCQPWILGIFLPLRVLPRLALPSEPPTRTIRSNRK